MIQHSPTPTDWHALEKRTFGPQPGRAIPLLQFGRFGITLLRLDAQAVSPTPDDAELDLFNVPGRQLRLRQPFRIVLESVFDFEREEGVRERRVPLLSMTLPDDFCSPMRVDRPVWFLIFRGRYKNVAGKLNGYRSHLEQGQAHFTPLVEMPEEGREPPKLVG